MVTPLKQSTTSQEIMLGPFVDSTDGNTEEIALTLNSVDLWIWKQGATAMVNPLAGATHMNNGMYYFVADATDSNTLGAMKVYCHKSGALPVVAHCAVYPTNVYDSLFGSDALQVDVTQIGGDAQSATDLKDFADAGYDPATNKVQGLVLCDTTTTNTDMVSQANITAILADTNELQTDWVNGGRLDLIVDAILADTNELQTDWVNGGRLDLLIDAIKAITDALTLAAIADAVLDEVVDAAAPANANSFRETINIIAAVCAGKSSGGGGANLKFRDLGDTKDRIDETVDADGNRTAVTLDGT